MMVGPSFFFLVALLGSSSVAAGTTIYISSGSKLSSEGALSEPAELEVSGSFPTSWAVRKTYKRPFLRRLVVTSFLSA
jgi:hypothetical protein